MATVRPPKHLNSKGCCSQRRKISPGLRGAPMTRRACFCFRYRCHACSAHLFLSEGPPHRDRRERAACHRPDLEATIRAFSHRKLGVHTRSVLLHARPCRYAEAARACCVLRASDLSDKGGASGGGKSGDGGGGASGDGGDGGGRERNGGDLSGLAICHYVPCRSAASLSGLAPPPSPVWQSLYAVIFIYKQCWLLSV